MWLRHRKARQPLEAICVIACSTIAEGSGIRVSNTPIRISPPAMPNRPDRNAVATISSPSAPISSGVIRNPLVFSALLVRLAQTELSWPGTSFPEGGMRRLLFLNGIKAFEAAARSGSFAAAGSELNVSAAAISRMVHLLEQRLGVALFERKANRLADFRKHQPDIDVWITTGGAAAPFGDDWSCGIKLGDGQWPGLVSEPLFAADLL